MIWFIMIAAGLFTFATRFIMLSNGISNRPPPWLVDALGFVPIAVLTAIIVPAILIDPADQTIALWDNPRFVCRCAGDHCGLGDAADDHHDWGWHCRAMGFCNGRCDEQPRAIASRINLGL